MDVPLFTAEQMGVVGGLRRLRSLELRGYAWAPPSAVAGIGGLGRVEGLGAWGFLEALEVGFALPTWGGLLGLRGLRYLGVQLAAESKHGNGVEVRRLLGWEGLGRLEALKVRGTAHACEEAAWEGVTGQGGVEGEVTVGGRLKRLCLDGGLALLWSEGMKAALTRRFGVWDERNVEGVQWGTPLSEFKAEYGLA